jgi:hypothetical protein
LQEEYDEKQSQDFRSDARAASAPVFVAQNQRSDDGQSHDQRYGSSQGRWEGRLSAEDQAKFDSYYSRWLDYRRSNNRDEIVSMENRLRDVMSHYNIPFDVPFGQIASTNNQSYGVLRGDGDNDDRWQVQGCLWQRTTDGRLICGRPGAIR